MGVDGDESIIEAKTQGWVMLDAYAGHVVATAL